ncbi:MAG TPA: CBS domain-containing protein [Candidatus Dormibacteraeota bacterium]|nr:CBS domain-containing protein [Candidatus Dormibacteraeota bacterium]
MSTLLRHRTVSDVMTVRVHVASPQTPFKHLVRLIQENHVSAVPIVDRQGTPVGIVSEADLLLKELRAKLAADGRLRNWHRRPDRKAEGVIAADLMTSPALTVHVETPLTEAARVMQQRNVRRLVVVDDRGRIAGIVSRSDLLQIFLRTDEDLRQEIVRTVIPAMVPSDSRTVRVDVQANVVTLSGEVDRRSDAEILGRVTRQVDGVVDVVNELSYRWDDLRSQRDLN